MVTTTINLENAVVEVTKEVERKKTAKQWHKRDENSLWYELVACLLGSNVKFEHAQAATDYLNSCNLLSYGKYHNCYSDYENRIAKELAKPLFPPLTSKGALRKYRFPNIRARHICKTAKNIYGSTATLSNLLETSPDAYLARRKIVSQTVGIGPKQASLFLRNINFDDDLAILDSHVLRYMKITGLLSKDVKSVSQISLYEDIEKTLQDYARQMNKSLCHLDTAIWVVMRVYQRDF